MLKRRSISFTAVAVLSGVGVLAACSSGSDETKTSPAQNTATAPRIQSTGGLTRPVWATGDRLVDRVAADETIDIQVHLRMQNEAAAEAELARVSDPEDAHYGQFLTTEEFEAKYAPTEADVAALRAHLETQGLTVTHVPTNRAFVNATGRASDIERAFSTRLAHYAVRGTTKRAPMDTPSLPAAIAPRVLAVFGLTTPTEFQPRNVRVGGIPRDVDPEATAAPVACSEWWGQTADTSDPAVTGYGPLAMAPCGYKPGQIRNAYGLNTVVRQGNDGTGQKIAIVDAFNSPTLLADAQTYAANNDPDYPLAASQFSAKWGPGTVPTKQQTGWFGEQTLDVEAVHAVAPGAHIQFIGAISANDPDLVGAINMIIAGKLATVVSNSYGSPEWSSDGANDFVVWHSIATQAGLKGIGLYFSSGDDGDETDNNGPGNQSADFPASLDNAVAVGGTSLALSQEGAYLWEMGWETGYTRLLPPGDAGVGTATKETDDAGAPLSWQPAVPGGFQFGSGGGVSLVYEQPTWQAGIVPTAIANQPGAPARTVPDVAMLADPVTGFLIGQTSAKTGVYRESPIGGTSLASPLFTATMALAQQRNKEVFGFANPRLYKASKKGAFKDVVPSKTPTAVAVRPGTVAIFDYPSLTIHPAVGWDDVTGLGTPNGTKFLDALK